MSNPIRKIEREGRIMLERERAIGEELYGRTLDRFKVVPWKRVRNVLYGSL